MNKRRDKMKGWDKYLQADVRITFFIGRGFGGEDKLDDIILLPVFVFLWR
jgi:hypothetical protein